mmetsp:Transcript_27193/g.32123  ORF Transcript_27193/g.32123 Transcript_27193/m.32123 type:complete len:88 (+) Transcript_27193:1892-2155(+)
MKKVEIPRTCNASVTMIKAPKKVIKIWYCATCSSKLVAALTNGDASRTKAMHRIDNKHPMVALSEFCLDMRGKTAMKMIRRYTSSTS